MPKKPERHTQLKRRAAGPQGTTEKPQRGGTRLDVRKPRQAIEIERSGRHDLALHRLRKEQGAKRVLQVPQPHFDNAVEAARQAGMTVTVTNITGTRKKTVRARNEKR